MAEPETFLGTGNIGNSDVAQAVSDATAPVVAPDNVEAALKGEPAKEAPDAAGKDVDVNSLSDEQFEKLVARLASDSKLPYHKNPAWKRIISERNQSTQKADTLFRRYAEKDPQGALEQLLDEGLDEGSAMLKLRQMGIGLNAPQEKTEEKLPKTEVDDTEFIKLLNNMGVKYDQLTPDQIQFWKFQFQFNRQMMDPLNKFVEQSKTEKQRAEQEKTKQQYENEEKELSKQVKEKYGLDWDKEVMPELLNFLKENPHYSGTPKQLFKEVFFDKIEELGKRAKSVEDSKLNEEKKRIKSEDGSSSGQETRPAGVGKNFNATWDWLQNKYK